jgi:hypothetical protein
MSVNTRPSSPSSASLGASGAGQGDRDDESAAFAWFGVYFAAVRPRYGLHNRQSEAGTGCGGEPVAIEPAELRKMPGISYLGTTGPVLLTATATPLSGRVRLVIWTQPCAAPGAATGSPKDRNSR